MVSTAGQVPSCGEETQLGEGKAPALEGLPVKGVDRHAHRSLCSRPHEHKHHALAHRTKAALAQHPVGTVTISPAVTYAVLLRGNPYHPHSTSRHSNGWIRLIL